MLSPAPIELIFAPWVIKSLIVYSFNPFDKQIPVSLYPASSNIFLASFDKYAKSPLSIRIPLKGYPFGVRYSFATLMALGIPLCKVSYVSTRKTQLSGLLFAYFKKASYSSSLSVTNE